MIHLVLLLLAIYFMSYFSEVLLMGVNSKVRVIIVTVEHIVHVVPVRLLLSTHQLMDVKLLISTSSRAFLDRGWSTIVDCKVTSWGHDILLIFVHINDSHRPLLIKQLFLLRLGRVVIILHKCHLVGVIPIDLSFIIVA